MTLEEKKKDFLKIKDEEEIEEKFWEYFAGCTGEEIGYECLMHWTLSGKNDEIDYSDPREAFIDKKEGTQK